MTGKSLYNAICRAWAEQYAYYKTTTPSPDRQRVLPIIMPAWEYLTDEERAAYGVAAKRLRGNRR